MKTKITKHSIIRRKSRIQPIRLSQLKMSSIKRSEINKIRELIADPNTRGIERYSLVVYLKSLLYNENIKIITN